MQLRRVYRRLLREYGPQGWWPARSRYEVIVGAILTQNTSWKNVKKAMANLRKARMLSLRKIAAADLRYLQRLVRPSGFYRQKAERLRRVSNYIVTNYRDLGRFFARPKNVIRNELLSLNGIGKETADSILLYAGNKLIFPIDAYTVRMCRCLGMRVREKERGYERLRKLFERELPRSVSAYKEMHALIVEWGKRYRKEKDACEALLR